MRFPRTYSLATDRLRLRCPSRGDIPHVFSATRLAIEREAWDNDRRDNPKKCERRS